MMQTHAALTMAATLGALMALGTAPGFAIVIDDFSVGQIVVDANTPVDQTGLDPSHVIGGSRRIAIGQFGSGSRLEVTDDGQLVLSSTGWGYHIITYGAATSLDDVDLTAENHDRLRLTMGEIGGGFHPLGIYVNLPTYSSDNGISLYMQDAWDGLILEFPHVFHVRPIDRPGFVSQPQHGLCDRFSAHRGSKRCRRLQSRRGRECKRPGNLAAVCRSHHRQRRVPARLRQRRCHARSTSRRRRFPGVAEVAANPRPAGDRAGADRWNARAGRALLRRRCPSAPTALGAAAETHSASALLILRYAASRTSKCDNRRNSWQRLASSSYVPTSTIWPPSITTIRCASASVLGRCVMMMAVRPRVNSSST